MEKTIEAIKEFFFDFLGFIIPGLVVGAVWKYTFNQKLEIEGVDILLILLFAYVIGYIIFSITLYKNNLFNKIFDSKNFPIKLKPNSQKSIENDLYEEETFKNAKKIMDSLLTDKISEIQNFRARRNIAISSAPDQERKVFTFMFRAELFDQLHTISIITLMVLFLFLIGSFFSHSLNEYFQLLDKKWFLLFIVCSVMLRKGWARFYQIAMNIPFSIYIDKKGHK